MQGTLLWRDWVSRSATGELDDAVLTMPFQRARYPPQWPELAAAAKMSHKRCSQIGRKGKTAVRERHDLEYYTAIGRKRGSATKTWHGRKHREQIGHMRGAHHRRQPKQESEPGATSTTEWHASSMVSRNGSSTTEPQFPKQGAANLC